MRARLYSRPWEKRTLRVGEEPKTANLVKLSGNFLTASVLEALGEAMALISWATRY